MAMIRLCSPELDSTTDALLRRITDLENALRAGRFAQPAAPAAAPAPAPAPVQPEPVKEEPVRAEPIRPAEPIREPEVTVPEEMPEPAPVPAEPVRAAEPAPAPAKQGKVSLSELQKSAEKLKEWPEILQTIKQYSRSVAAAFVGSTAYISGNYVLIDAPEVAFELLRRPAQRDNMRDVIRQVTGRSYNLGPWKKEEEKEAGEDPLQQLMQQARDMGVEVTVKE